MIGQYFAALEFTEPLTDDQAGYLGDMLELLGWHTNDQRAMHLQVKRPGRLPVIGIYTDHAPADKPDVLARLAEHLQWVGLAASDLDGMTRLVPNATLAHDTH